MRPTSYLAAVAPSIGVGHRVEEVMACWVWMALNDCDAPGRVLQLTSKCLQRRGGCGPAGHLRGSQAGRRTVNTEPMPGSLVTVIARACPQQLGPSFDFKIILAPWRRPCGRSRQDKVGPSKRQALV